jgi:hypothetical protein
MTARVTQKQKILKHLMSKKSLSPLKAIGLFGCYRLASRIHELKKDGYPIDTILKDDGQGRTYGSYEINSEKLVQDVVDEYKRRHVA